MRATHLQPAFCEFIPADIQQNTLYISLCYATATHLCACGCGFKVVTPFGPADWQLTFDGTVTLRPSIGNGQSPCRSHYYIRNDHIDWMRPISTTATHIAGQRDRAALRTLHSELSPTPPWWHRLSKYLRTFVIRRR